MIQLPWGALPAIAAVFGLCAWLLRLMFRAELGEFRQKLMVELNGRYMNSQTANERLERLSDEIVHTRHNLRNEIQIALGIEVRRLPVLPARDEDARAR